MNKKQMIATALFALLPITAFASLPKSTSECNSGKLTSCKPGQRIVFPLMNTREVAQLCDFRYSIFKYKGQMETNVACVKR